MGLTVTCNVGAHPEPVSKCLTLNLFTGLPAGLSQYFHCLNSVYLFGTPEGRPLGRPWRRWTDNLEEYMWSTSVNLTVRRCFVPSA